MAELTKLGRYELRRVLGKGAMGVVYEGFDPDLSRRVAVKTILKNDALDEQTERAYAARFIQEAKAVARLNHPNIVQVYEFGVESGVAYLVMEFIQGRELRSFFGANEYFELDESVRIMCELLDALDFAHEAGVIHRDVKPANVMLDAQRRAKLADFGVARIQDGAHRSQADTMVGTPAFMSPEQISGAKVDRRTDIFSAGNILYQLLTGEQPFKGAGAWTVVKAIMQDDPPQPSTIVVNISPVFDEIVSKALAKKPVERFGTAREFAAALRGALNNRQQASTPVVARQKAKAEPRASETELEFWRPIQNSNDPAEFEFYLEQFPNGTYAQLARHKIIKLREPIEAARKEADEKATREAEEKARQDTFEKAKRDAAERVKREAEEKARQAQARLKQQQEAAARAKAVVDGDATVAIASARPTATSPAAQEKSFAVPAIVVAAAIVVGVIGYMLLGRTPAPVSALVADAPSAQKVAPPSTPAIDAEEIRHETEDRLRKEFADKAAVERAAMEKAVAEKAAAEKAAAEKLALAKTGADKAEAEKVMQKAAADRIVAEKAAMAKASAAVAAPAIDAEKIRRETEDRLRREFADKAAADKALAQKEAAEKATVGTVKPGWPNSGDRWVYEARDSRHPDQKYTATVDVRQVTGSRVRDVFKFPDGAETDSVHISGVSMVSVAPGIVQFSPYLRAFQEIRVGESWSDVDLAGLPFCLQASCDASARVTGKERITVRAGNFDTWKIEVSLKWKANVVGGGGGRGGQAERGVVTFSYWYAEQPRRFVKYQARSYDAGTGSAGTWVQPDMDMELVSYRPATGH